MKIVNDKKNNKTIDLDALIEEAFPDYKQTKTVLTAKKLNEDYNEEHYMAVVEMFDDPQKALETEPVLIIFRVGEPDEDGLDTFDVVDDDEEYFEVAGIFEQRLSEIYNIEE